MCCQAVMAVWSSAATLASRTSASTFALWIMKAALRQTRRSTLVFSTWWVGKNKSHRENDTFYINHSTGNARHIYFIYFLFFQPKSGPWRTPTWKSLSSRQAVLASQENLTSTSTPRQVLHLKPVSVKNKNTTCRIRQNWFLSLSLFLQISVRKAKGLTWHSTEENSTFHDKYSKLKVRKGNVTQNIKHVEFVSVSLTFCH